MTISVACIECDENGFNERPFGVQVYDTIGRLIIVAPKRKGDEPFYLSSFESYQDALLRLQECYPDITLVKDWRELEKLYKKDGYHYPSDIDVYTPYICSNCGEPITITPRSRGAGQNAPYGALITIFYECTSCGSEYAEHRQMLQYGQVYYWSKRAGNDGPFEDCEEPDKIPKVNTFGFGEIYLVPTGIGKQRKDYIAKEEK